MSANLKFARAARLRKPREFQRVFKRARRVNDRNFRVFARANETGHGRLGLAISKRVDKRAVVRNRLKRQIRESFRRHRALLSGLDIVVMANAPAASSDNQQLSRSLDRLWRELKEI